MHIRTVQRHRTSGNSMCCAPLPASPRWLPRSAPERRSDVLNGVPSHVRSKALLPHKATFYKRIVTAAMSTHTSAPSTNPYRQLRTQQRSLAPCAPIIHTIVPTSRPHLHGSPHAPLPPQRHAVRLCNTGIGLRHDEKETRDRSERQLVLHLVVRSTSSTPSG